MRLRLPLTPALCPSYSTFQIQQIKEVSPPEAIAMLEQIAGSIDGMASAAWDVSACCRHA